MKNAKKSNINIQQMIYQKEKAFTILESTNYNPNFLNQRFNQNSQK